MRRAGLLSLALCLVVGVLARAAALNAFSGVDELHGDEGYFIQTATSLAEGQGHPGSVRPPLYPAFAAGVFGLAGQDLGALRRAQLVLGLLAIVAVHQLAAARCGTRAGCLAGLACALSPDLSHYAHFLWSETLMAVLLSLCFWCLDAYDRRGAVWLLGVGGILLGLSALTRETWAHFALLASAWVAWPLRRTPRAALARAGLLLSCAALVVLPWTVRNQGVHGSFVLISTNRWFPIAAGNVFPQDDWLLGKVELKPWRQQVKKKDPELVQEEYWRGVALEAIQNEQPAWIFKKVARTFCGLLSPGTQTLRFLAEGWLPDPGPAARRRLVLSDVLGNGLLLALGLAGLWLAPLGRTSLLVALALCFTFAVHVAANAVPRFIVPFYPLLALQAGALLAGGLAQEGRRWRVPCALLTVVLLLWAVGIQWDGDVAPLLAAGAAP